MYYMHTYLVYNTPPRSSSIFLFMFILKAKDYNLSFELAYLFKKTLYVCPRVEV